MSQRQMIDENNIDRIIAISRFGIENGYRLRDNKNKCCLYRIESF